MKKEPSHTIDDLLVKYLLGEASGAEQLQVQQWMAADTVNRQYFDQFALIWEQSKQLAVASTVDEDAAWERFKQRRTQEQLAPVKKMRQWLRPLLAAAALLLVAMGAWLWHAYNSNALLVVRAYDKVINDTLPDGSVVTLNKQASISYSAHFRGGERAVTLSGEAFFTVVPNDKKPFVIYANDAVIKVLGTSFNVKSRQHETEVIVETGRVQVSKRQYAVQLNAHEKATVTGTHEQPIKQANEDELYNYYRTRTFSCNGTPLYKLVATMNEAYDAHIVIENENLRNLPLTTTFQDEPLDTILNVIRQTFQQVTVTRNGNQIVLR